MLGLYQSPANSLSEGSEKLFKEVREEPVYIGVFGGKKENMYWNKKMLPLSTK